MRATKLCECGCGHLAPVATKTRLERGWIKGQPKRFISGHHYALTVQKHSFTYEVKDRGFVTPCWIWRGGLNNGYARRNGKRIHRLFYEQRYGAIPTGFELDHLCQVKSCINVEHLELVTHAVNVQRGPHTRLTWKEVSYIRSMGHTLSRAELGRQFSVTPECISHIMLGKTWNGGEACTSTEAPVQI